MSFPTAALAYKRVMFVNKMADTADLGARDNMSTWRPTLESGWYYLGQSAANNLTTVPDGVVVRALEDDALRDVTSWERVWTDDGSPNTKDYALWRGVPPSSDYAVLGGILSTSAGYAAPDSAQTYGIKAIRRDLLKISSTRRLWDDQGSGATNDASVWHAIVPGGITPIATGAMIPMPDYLQPPEDMGLGLDPAMVLEVISTSATEGDAATAGSADKQEEGV